MQHFNFIVVTVGIIKDCGFNELARLKSLMKHLCYNLISQQECYVC